jgi:ribosomal peptide maturation radical SAM protein 1
MPQLNHLKEKILTVLGGGEVLLIIPPFGSINDIALGPHILQTLAREQGFKTDLLYLNLLLASILGVERYDSIYSAPERWMLAERLLTRSAYGSPPLGQHRGTGPSLGKPGEGSKRNPDRFYETLPPFDPGAYITAEQQCQSFLDEVIPVISGLAYKVIGCSAAMMRQTNCSIALLAGIKRHSPGTVTLIGGSSCKGEMAAGIASLSPAGDYIFSGESETSFPAFLRDYSVQEFPSQRIIEGEPLGDLDSLPLVDYEIFFEQYARFLEKEAPRAARIWYETSRGCWWAEKSPCHFCSEEPVPYRHKSVAKTVRDLERISAAYPDKKLFMTDINMPPSYHRELLPLLNKKKGFPSIGYQMRVTLDFHELVCLKEAGIDFLLPGIETFSTPLLKLMNKGITARQSLLFLRHVACAGIYAYWYLLWGFPGDRVSDYEEVLRILPLIGHLQPPRRFEPMVLMRFSPYLNHRQRHGITNVQPWAVLDEIYPDWAHREKLAVYYSGEFPSAAYQNQGIIREIAHQVEAWKKNWKKTALNMGRFMGAFAIYDNRDFQSKARIQILDRQQAGEVMNCCVYNESESLKWAVAEKWGIVVDSWYVPLVTGSPGILSELGNIT